MKSYVALIDRGTIHGQGSKKLKENWQYRKSSNRTAAALFQNLIERHGESWEFSMYAQYSLYESMI